MSAPTARTVSVWEQYVGGSGLTITLVGLLAAAVAWPIQQAQWVPHMPPLTVITVLGAALAVASHRSSWSPLRAHLTASGIGAAVVALAACALVVKAAEALARRQIGGHTGDVLGAVQQACEIAALFVFVALQ
ncbi:MAG: adenosylcobinamide-GDP ribazoletransferase [Proteobacteria bacterium]|nr:adenosylcobinamide-GDP ribazoletransferase [Pseudomonadota bacterium]